MDNATSNAHPGIAADAPVLGAVAQGIVDLTFEVTDRELDLAKIRKGDQRVIAPQELTQLLKQLQGFTPARQFGGSALNSIYTFELLGGRCESVVRFGDDELGHAFAADARSRGGTLHAVFDTERPTATSVVLVTPDGSRSMLTCHGAASMLTPAESAPLEHPPKHLAMNLFEGYLLAVKSDAPLRSAQALCAQGVPLAFALAAPWICGRFPEQVKELLSRAAILFANEEEAAALCGESEVTVAARKLGSPQRLAVITAGGRGAFLSQGSGVTHIPVKPVTVVDTTGAGDAFAGAFLRGYLYGMPIEKAAAAAAVVAAEVVTHIGGRASPQVRRQWEAIAGGR